MTRMTLDDAGSVGRCVRLAALATSLVVFAACRSSSSGADGGTTGMTYDFVVAWPWVDSSTASSVAGFNLDGLYSLASDSAGCNIADRTSDLDLDQNAGGCSPASCTTGGCSCVGGVDDNLPLLLDLLEKNTQVSWRNRLSQAAAGGRMVVLVRVSGVTSLVNDSDVTVSLYHGWPADPCATISPGEFTVDDASLLSPGALDQPLVSWPAAIQSGRLMVAWDAATDPMPVSFNGSPSVSLFKVRMRANIESTGTFGWAGNFGASVDATSIRDAVAGLLPTLRTGMNGILPNIADLPSSTGACAGEFGAPVGALGVGVRFNLNHASITGTASGPLFPDSASAATCGPGSAVGDPIANSGFEAGSLAAWTTAGAAASIAPTPHTGTFAIQLGSTSPSDGDSTASQTFVLPPGAGALSFWYDVHCPDSLTYDWATAYLTDNANGTTITLLAPQCSNGVGWQLSSTDVSALAGQSVTLTFVSHDDNYAADPTYTWFDDVSVVLFGVRNPGFEAGTLAAWTTAGAAISTTTSSHSGGWAAQLGSSSPTSGDSTISQTFAMPTTASALNFWYAEQCPDSVARDWATAYLTDNTTGATITLLGKQCSNGIGWQFATASVSSTAGHVVTLTLVNHDDASPGNPTFTSFDDVTISLAPQGPALPAAQNPGFESGALAPWTASGAAASITSSSHTGSWATQLGSTSPTSGDSALSQTFTLPLSASTLSVWYDVHCPDTLTYDWARAFIVDNVTSATAVVLSPQCTDGGGWQLASTDVSSMAGHSITLTLVSHDDGYPTDPTYTWFDDVTVQ